MGSRRPGPIDPGYWGCRRACWDAGEHLKDDGCVNGPPPPCRHPVESIGYDSEGEGRAVECQDCRTPLSVQKLAQEAHVSLSIGDCYCSEDVCQGRCPTPTPSAWSLDPAKVLRILELESHL